MCSFASIIYGRSPIHIQLRGPIRLHTTKEPMLLISKQGANTLFTTNDTTRTLPSQDFDMGLYLQPSVHSHSKPPGMFLHTAVPQMFGFTEHSSTSINETTILKNIFPIPEDTSKDPLICVSWIQFNISNETTKWPGNNKILNLSSYISSLNMISLYKYIGNLIDGCYFLCSHIKEKKALFFSYLPGYSMKINGRRDSSYS